MDFKLFRAVIRRYKRIVISGSVLAIVLAVLSYGMPGLKGGKPTIIPRGSEVWQGNAVVLLSQAGNPYDRAVAQVVPGKGLDKPPQTIGDLSYMSNLSSVYAALANSDSVQHEVARDMHVQLCPVTTTATAPAAGNPTATCRATVVAATLQQAGTGSPLPMITLTSSAPTAGEAAKLAATTIAVMRSQVSRQQAAAGTPVDQRIQLQTINSGSPATLAQGPKTSMSILVLFAVMAATIGLAFILNNHSDNPVRSTRRRLDEGLGEDGRLGIAGAPNGHPAVPGHGLAQTGGARMKLIGLRRDPSDIRLADEANDATRRVSAEGASATDGGPAWSDRMPAHMLRRSRSEAESRD